MSAQSLIAEPMKDWNEVEHWRILDYLQNRKVDKEAHQMLEMFGPRTVKKPWSIK